MHLTMWRKWNKKLTLKEANVWFQALCDGKLEKRRGSKGSWRGLQRDLPPHKQQNLALQWRMKNFGSPLMGWVFLNISLMNSLEPSNQGDVQRCEEHHQPRFWDLLRLAACAGASVGGGLWGLLHDPGSSPTCILCSQPTKEHILLNFRISRGRRSRGSTTGSPLSRFTCLLSGERE